MAPQPAPTPTSGGRQLPLFWIVTGLVIVGGLVAVIATNSGTTSAGNANPDAPVYATVDVDGSELPTAPEGGEESDLGAQLPTLSGTNLDGKSMTIRATTGAKVVMVVAHWCPHCQAEVSRIVAWYDRGTAPTNVEFLTVSTAVSKQQPNFPPAQWLYEEKWPFPVLVDDEVGTAFSALGGSSFPLIVFVDAQGKIAHRFSGEMPIEDFDKQVQALSKPA